MSNANFNPITSTNEVYRDTDTTRCLTDDLDTIEETLAPKIGTNAPVTAFLQFANSKGIEFLTADSRKGRLHTLDKIGGWVGWSINANYTYPDTANNIPGGWLLDDPDYGGWFFKLDTRSNYYEFAVYKIPSGTGYHTDAISDVTGLAAALDGKAATNHTHSEYAAANHNHDDDYAAIDHTHTGYAAASHTHTKANITDFAHTHSEYAAVNHNHDTVYAAIDHDHDDDYAALNHTHAAYTTVEASATLSVDDWTGNGPYTQTVNITGITSTCKAVVSLAMTATATQREAARNALLMCTAQANGTITVTADGTVPDVDLPITIFIV